MHLISKKNFAIEVCVTRSDVAVHLSFNYKLDVITYNIYLCKELTAFVAMYSLKYSVPSI